VNDTGNSVSDTRHDERPPNAAERHTAASTPTIELDTISVRKNSIASRRLIIAIIALLDSGTELPVGRMYRKALRRLVQSDGIDRS
jgi:hypothetical protein